MDALRYSMLAPSASTVLMVFGCFDTMMQMIKCRYAAKDDNGKMLLQHPYTPWTKFDPKYQDSVDKAYRAFKAYENAKEWTLLCLPCMWIFAMLGSELPYVTNNVMDAITISSSVAYMVSNSMYVSGYVSSPEKRTKGFKIRRKVAEFWLFGSFISISWCALVKYGIVAGK